MGGTLGWNCCRHIEGAPRMVHFWRSGSGFRVFLQGFLGVYHHPDWSERWRCDDLENPMVGIVEAIPREKRWLFGHTNSCQQWLDEEGLVKGNSEGTVCAAHYAAVYWLEAPSALCEAIGQSPIPSLSVYHDAAEAWQKLKGFTSFGTVWKRRECLEPTTSTNAVAPPAFGEVDKVVPGNAQPYQPGWYRMGIELS